MKNILLTILFVLCAVLFSVAQNLVQNGDLELWDNINLPTGWDKAENITQATTPVHGGTYSAMHISDESTKDLQQNVEGISEGANYTISYWYLDNDPLAKTRIWSYWLNGNTTINAHEEILRPNEYSEDNPDWQEFNVTLTAPPTADGFRFEVRVYKDGGNWGGSVYYDDFSIVEAGISPEPTNYPADFDATANNLAIDLTWTDATGGQLPAVYLVLGSDQDNIVAPEDGTPVDDDTDLSDGSGALNVYYGTKECSFGSLLANTTYFFKIYPYTNGGLNIDYKTDGTAPSASATTASLNIINQENFNESWGEWVTISVTGDQAWDRDNNYGLGNTPCARMSGYEGGSHENDDWLISPSMDFTVYENEKLSFHTAMNYSGPQLEVKISTDYNGGGDPYSATWTLLTATLSQGSWEWTYSGEIDVSMYENPSVYIAFQYTSTDVSSATWEVDDIMITGETGVGINHAGNMEEKIKIFPNPSFGIINVFAKQVGICDVEVFSTTGELVYRDKLNVDRNTINLGNKEPGIYLIRFRDISGNMFAKRIIVQ